MINFDGLSDAEVAKLARDFYEDTLSIFSELRKRDCTIFIGSYEIKEPTAAERVIKIVKAKEL